jgi:hypothetical protein
MATLVHRTSGIRLDLCAQHSVGRSSQNHLTIPEPWISSSHARFDWTGVGWEIRDLASKNGTYVDHKRLNSGEPMGLVSGALIAFGRRADPWLLVSTAPPEPTARSSDGRQVEGRDELLMVPDLEDPLLTVFRGEGGSWIADLEGEERVVQTNDVLVVGGQAWTLNLPIPLVGTLETSLLPASLEEVELHFDVSRDEQHVGLTVRANGRVFDLGHRSHHYILLTLARIRIQEANLGSDSCGFVETPELARMLQMEANALNVAIHRIRRQFSEIAIENGARVIERKGNSRLIRLGVALSFINVT